ncbi:MAG: hypothetical protein Q4G40_06700 [Brachybacterium sp.]|nr:hypothetical protein [Brachybacterium sp.]
MNEVVHPQTESRTTSEGNNPVVSVALFLVLFGTFCVGLYVLSLMTAVTFVVGLGICLLALFGTFTLVPKFLT